MPHSLNIAIVGAGPVGCLLARLLLNCPRLRVVIYEADTSPDSRGQGGTLDLHDGTGIAALKKAGLYDEFLRHARFDGEALLLCDKNLTGYLQFAKGVSDNSRGSPEIDRMVLRQLLLDSLPPDTIRWGHKLLNVSDGNVLHFAQGTEQGFDLVVGADGAWSRVRRFLTPERPSFCGIEGYAFLIPDAAQTAPKVSELVNRGSLYAYSDGKALMGQQLGDGSIQVSVYTTESQDDDALFSADDERRRHQIARQFSDWAPELLELLAPTSEYEMTRRIYTLPVGFRWLGHPAITLVGDAAHLMPPFAGEGVNLGFEDVMKLSDAIRGFINGGYSTVDEMLRVYEKDAFQRARRGQELSVGVMQDMFFTPGAPRTSIERWMIRHVRYRIHPWAFRILYPVIAVNIYIFYFLYKLFR